MARRTSQQEIDLERLPKSSLTRESLRETLSLGRYLRPYRTRFIAGLSTLFVSASLGLAFPLLAGTLIVLNYAVAYFTSRFRKVEHIIEGVPKVLARNGTVFHDVLRSELVSLDDFHEALRMNNVADPEQVALALLETNGSISVVSTDAGGAERAEKYVQRLPPRSLHRRRRRPGSPEAD